MAKSKQVLLKRSNVKGKVPALSAMTHGEMFLNYNDGVLMSKSSSNAVLKWSDDSKMATKNELNLKLDKIEAEGSYVKNADFQYLVSEIEDNERVITTAFEKFRESAGFNENGESTLGKSLTEAISELDGVKALANKVTVDGNTVKITTLSANTFSANTAKVVTVSANTISANTIKSNLIGIADSAKTSYSAVTSTSAKTSVSATTSFSAATAKSADSAKKLSTGSVGNYYTPVYINNGVPQTISEIDYKKVIRREVSNDASIVNIPIIDAALSPLHSANRLQFAKPAGIIVEYSIDGGSTWVDYGLSDVDKVKFVSGEEINIFAGKGQSSKATSNDKVRITINASDAGFYTAAKSLLINFSTNGSNNCKVDVETSKRGTDTVFTVWKTGLGVSGWSGWNSLPLNFSLGGGVTQTTNTGSLRLTFYSDGAGNYSTNPEHFRVLSLLLFGDTTWATPSTMAKTGHLYDYDINQNMILPSGVSVNGTISASTIKSTTTDDLRRDIGILSGDTYILNIDVGDGTSGGVISKTLSSDEISKIESAKDVIVNIINDNGEGYQYLKTTCFIKEGDYIQLMASAVVPINNSDDEGYTVTIGVQISIEKKSNILTAQEGYVVLADYSSIIYDISNSFLTINLGDYESYSDENGNYIIVDYETRDKLSNCVGAKVILPGQIEAYLTSKTTHRPVNEAPYHVYGFTCLRINRDNNKYNYLYGDIIELTTSSTNKIYVNWGGQITIGYHALDSDSAITSYSAITATSAKTSNSAITSTKWSTGRKITLSGDATGNVTLDGSQNVTLNVNVLSADTVPASGVKGVLSSDNMPTRYATSDEVDENNEILTKALNRLNTSAGFNSLGESTLPSGMSLTKAILELQKGGGVADKVNVTESSSKSYIVSRETTDSDETSLHYDGAIWSENGQLYASSDKNLKEHVGNVDGNPELIKRIPKVFYHWKDDEQKRIQMGTYAQDIEKVYPEVVSRDDNGNLAVGYDRLSVIALAGIDELYKMIQDLKEENKQLRKELDSLKK